MRDFSFLSPRVVEWLGVIAGHTPASLGGAKLGVAVSGGSDSVALLLTLHLLASQKEWRITVLHVDHALRPESSVDADWVKALAERLELPFVSTRLLPPDPQQLKGQGLESWARSHRLAWLARMTQELGLQAVVLGHHQRDQAETVLWRLMRGCSTAGLGGLRPLRRLQTPAGQVQLWRPLLTSDPSDLRLFLKEMNQDWREDPTNAESTFFRNRLRNEVLPYLSGFQPRLSEHLARLAETMTDIHLRLSQQVRPLLRRSPPGTLLWSGHPTGSTLREMLRQWWLREFPTCTDTFNAKIAARLEDLLTQNHSGRRVSIGILRIVRIPEGLEILSPDTGLKKDGSKRCTGTFSEGAGRDFVSEYQPRQPLDFDRPAVWHVWRASLYREECVQTITAHTIWVKTETVAQGLAFGAPQAGDRFTPAGHTRSRTLARWFIDAKIPRHRRSALGVIAAGSEVLWVPEPGFRSIHVFAEPGPGRVQIILNKGSGE